MRSAASAILALAATAQAAYTGFNCGNTFTDGSAKAQSDFETEFKTAKGLEGTNGAFTSARLYTMIQGGTTNDPISAIPAAMNTGTSLLLGLWASAGDAAFANELAALKTAITKYGSSFGSLVAGISVGSEDLYRMTPTSIENGGYAGAQPDTIAGYISQVRKAIAGTALANAKVGHVDTWTAWTNSSNQAVIDACDWVGVDEYPYWEKQHTNGIAQAKSLFDNAVSATAAAVGNKEVWITETGWPVSGKTVGEAGPGLDNAKTFWDEVGCPMFGVKNVWWYTLQDTSSNPNFSVIGSTMTTTPLYDLSCSNVTTTGSSSNSTSSGSSSGNSTSSSSNSSGSGSGSGSSSSSGSGSSSNSTVTSSSPSSTSTHLASGSAATAAQGVGAALIAVFAAMFAL